MNVLKLRHESLLCPRGWRNLRRLTGVVLSLGCLFLTGVLSPQAVRADGDEWEMFEMCRRCVNTPSGNWHFFFCTNPIGGGEGVGEGRCRRKLWFGDTTQRDTRELCEEAGFEGINWSRTEAQCGLHFRGRW